MIIGIGTASPVGIAGGLFHMLNHAVYKSSLFLVGGAVEKKAGTADLEDLGGLAKFMPVTFLCFLVASLSISGIPPFNGFVSKWMVYQGIIESAGAKDHAWVVWLSAAMFGSALTIASFMKLIHAIFLGRRSEGAGDVKEAGVAMLLPMLALAAICVIFGVFAFILPLKILIAPAIGVALSYAGTWSPVIATALIGAGVVLGLLVYLILMPRNVRTTEHFVGGADPESLPRVSGTDFYNTVKELAPLKGVYRREEEGSLDIYNVCKKPVYSLAGMLQSLHNGVLPTYMVWCLVGMVGMFLFLFLR
jgi:NADH:ubiquinone oxidoreductase subunit 5 (subunit L)/multisubunit Na+/H+ antiporter MnhA subunit